MNYTWAITPVGGTVLSTGANGTTLSASFAGPVAPATLASYTVTPSIPGGSTGTACQVQVPAVPPSSCGPAAGNLAPVAGQPWSGAFNVVNPQGGQTYSWSATGGTPSSGTGLNFPVSFPANLSTVPVTYNVQLSSGGGPLPSSLCSVTLPPVPAPLCSPAGLQTVTAGAPVPFSISNVVPGVNYTWAIAPVGGTVLATGANGTTLSASFAGPVAPATSVSYTVTPSIPGGSTGTACQVQVQTPTLSCAGTTGRFTDLTPLTIGAEVTVPLGQQANIGVEVTDRATGITTSLPALTFGPGTHAWTFNTSCFVKLNLICIGPGGGFLDRQDSVNVCAP